MLNLFSKKKRTHRCREQLWLNWGESCGEGEMDKGGQKVQTSSYKKCKKNSKSITYFVSLYDVINTTQVSTLLVSSLKHNLVKPKKKFKSCVHYINPMTLISFIHTEKHGKCPIKLIYPNTLLLNKGKRFMW